VRGPLVLPELRSPYQRDTPKITEPLPSSLPEPNRAKFDLGTPVARNPPRQPPHDRATNRIIDLETTVGSIRGHHQRPRRTDMTGEGVAGGGAVLFAALMRTVMSTTLPLACAVGESLFTRKGRLILSIVVVFT
jgi:hypothetical protein